MKSRAAVAALAVVVYLLIPYRWAIAVRSHDLEHAHQLRAQAAATRVRLNHARLVLHDGAGWSKRLAAAEAAFPPTADVAGELAHLRTFSAASGVRLVSITAQPPAGGGGTPAGEGTIDRGVEAIELHMQVEGEVPQLQAFFSQLRASDRLFTTTRIDLEMASPPLADVTGEMWTMPT